MGNRIVLLASVVLAGAALAATPVSAAPAAEECLAKPKGQTPAGKHWYYYTNRATQRRCWFLGDEGEKTVSAKPRKPPVAANSVRPDRDVGRPPPAADARAELVDEPRVEQPATPITEQPVMPVTPPALEASQGEPDDANTRDWAVASRWPDQSDAFASHRATVVDDPAPVSQVENPLPVLAAVQVQQPSAAVEHAADVNLAPFAAALILVVTAGGTIFMFLSSRRRDRRNVSGHHRVMHHSVGRTKTWPG